MTTMNLKAQDDTISDMVKCCQVCKCNLGSRHVDINEQAANIIERGAKFFDLPVSLISSDTRRKEISEARQMIMAVLREQTKYSIKSIGEMFNRRDHTTVVYSLQRIKNLCATEPETKNKFLLLTEFINRA